MSVTKNPKTGRSILVNGPTYKRLQKQGLLQSSVAVAQVFATSDLLNLIIEYHVLMPPCYSNGTYCELAYLKELNVRIVSKRWCSYFDRIVKTSKYGPYFWCKVFACIKPTEALIERSGIDMFCQSLSLRSLNFELLEDVIFAKYEKEITKAFLDVDSWYWVSLGLKTRHCIYKAINIHNLDTGLVAKRYALRYIYNVNGKYYGSANIISRENIRALY